MIGDPRSVGDEIPYLIVHCGGIAQDIGVDVGRKELAGTDAGGVELIERGKEFFEPHASDLSHEQGILHRFGEEVGAVVAVLFAGKPSRGQGVVADTHTAQIAADAVGVAQ